MFFVLSWAWDKEKIWSPHEGLRFKCYHLSYSIYKHNAKDIADPSSLQNMCHIWTSRWALLTVESLWLSGRALEHGIWRCEVWFLMVTLSNAHDKTKNIFFLFLTKLKTYPLSYSICNIIDPHFRKISDIFAPAFHYMLTRLFIGWVALREPKQEGNWCYRHTKLNFWRCEPSWFNMVQKIKYS